MHASLSMQINSPLYIGHKGAMLKQSKKVKTEGWLWPLRPAGRTSDTCVQCLTFAWAEVQNVIGIRLRLAFPLPCFVRNTVCFSQHLNPSLQLVSTLIPWQISLLHFCFSAIMLCFLRTFWICLMSHLTCAQRQPSAHLLFSIYRVQDLAICYASNSVNVFPNK